MGTSSSPKKGATAPAIFGLCLLWPNGWMDQDATWYRDRPQPRPHCARWEPSSPSPKRGHSPLNFRPMSIVAIRLDGSRCHSLGVDTDFILSSDPHTWSRPTSAVSVGSVNCSLTVISDAAERSIALVLHFNQSITRNEAEMRTLLQVVADRENGCRTPASRH